MRSTLQHLSRRLTYFGLIGVGLVSLLWLSSCATMPVADSTLEPRRLGREFPTYTASPEKELTPVPFTEPTGQLTLRAAFAAALLNSPALAAFSWEVRAREAGAIQAGRLPNPEFSLEVEEFGGGGDRTAFDGSDTTVRIGQLFELGDKRAKRQRVATLERDLAAWDYETHRLDVFTTVVKAFVAVLATQRQVTLAEEQVRVAEEAIQTIAGQVKVGAVSPAEESRARVALARSQVDLALRKREQVAARLRLAATWGSSTVTFSVVTGDLESVIPPPSADDLLPHLSHNPDVARWDVEKKHRRAVLELEQARQIPDVEMDAGVRYINADKTAALVFETNVPLMLFDKNRGRIQEASARLAKVNAQQRAAEVHSQAALTIAHQALFSSFEYATALRDTIIPQARAAFEEVNQAYRRGGLRYLDVLDARRTLFELHGQYVEALANYHTAAADMERLIAKPLDALSHIDERE